jgi:hypothetical protein
MAMRRQAYVALAGIVLYAVLDAAPMLSQSTGQDCEPIKPPTPDTLPSYTIRQLPTLDTLTVRNVRLLEGYLSCRQWQNALKTYLRNYQPELPAWIVYIDEKDVVHQQLLAHGNPTRLFTGERYVWLILFSRNRVHRVRADAEVAQQPAPAAIARLVQLLRAARDFDTADSLAAADAERAAAASAATSAAKVRTNTELAALGARVAAERARVEANKQDASAETKKAAAEAKAKSEALDTATVLAVRLSREAAARAAEASAKVTADSTAAAARIASRKDLTPGAAGQGDAGTVDTSDLRFARRAVVHRQDPMLTTLIKGLLRNFGAEVKDPLPFLDSVRVLRMQQVSADTTKTSLWVAIGRWGLVENSVVELAVSPVAGKEFEYRASGGAPPARIQSIYSNLANSKQDQFELGVLAGVTVGRRIPEYDATQLRVTRESAHWAFAGYVTAIWNNPKWWFTPWRRPEWQRASVGLFAGTSVLGASLAEQVVAGLTIGHLLSDAGLAVGAAWLPEPTLRNGHVANNRKARLLLGTDLRF